MVSLSRLVGRRPPVPGRLELVHTLRSGVTVRVRSESDWWVYNEIFVEGDYDPAIDTLASPAAAGGSPVVLDLGANVGLFAARVVHRLAPAGIAAEVISVEGSPSVYRELVERVGEVQVPPVAIRPVHGLVGSRSGRATISEVDFGARNTLVPQHNAGIAPVSKMAHHDVDFVDLDALTGHRPVGLIKCDVEGSEQQLIETYGDTLLRRTAAAVFELHHDLCQAERCVELLEAAGLRVVDSRDQQDATSLVLLTRR
jgi:FkbM family methyltransferase